MQRKRFLIPALAALGLFFLGLSGLGLSSANAAGLSPMSAGHDQTAMSGKSSVTKIQWGWRGGWGGTGLGLARPGLVRRRMGLAPRLGLARWPRIWIWIPRLGLQKLGLWRLWRLWRLRLWRLRRLVN